MGRKSNAVAPTLIIDQDSHASSPSTTPMRPTPLVGSWGDYTWGMDIKDAVLPQDTKALQPHEDEEKRADTTAAMDGDVLAGAAEGEVERETVVPPLLLRQHTAKPDDKLALDGPHADPMPLPELPQGAPDAPNPMAPACVHDCGYPGGGIGGEHYAPQPELLYPVASQPSPPPQPHLRSYVPQQRVQIESTAATSLYHRRPPQPYRQAQPPHPAVQVQPPHSTLDAHQFRGGFDDQRFARPYPGATHHQHQHHPPRNYHSSHFHHPSSPPPPPTAPNTTTLTHPMYGGRYNNQPQQHLAEDVVATAAAEVAQPLPVPPTVVQVSKFAPPPPPTAATDASFLKHGSPDDAFYSIVMRWYGRVLTAQLAHPCATPCPPAEEYLHDFPGWLDEVTTWWTGNFANRKGRARQS